MSEQYHHDAAGGCGIGLILVAALLVLSLGGLAWLFFFGG